MFAYSSARPTAAGARRSVWSFLSSVWLSLCAVNVSLLRQEPRLPAQTGRPVRPHCTTEVADCSRSLFDWVKNQAWRKFNCVTYEIWKKSVSQRSGVRLETPFSNKSRKTAFPFDRAFLLIGSWRGTYWIKVKLCGHYFCKFTLLETQRLALRRKNTLSPFSWYFILIIRIDSQRDIVKKKKREKDSSKWYIVASLPVCPDGTTASYALGFPAVMTYFCAKMT